MSVEDNVALMRSLYEAYSRRNPAPLFETLSDTVQFHPLQATRQYRFSGRAALGLDPVG